jgi:hypothetical protein
MATDRYSDDYTIVVGGGSGTMTIDSDLEITGGLLLAFGLSIPGNLAVTGDLSATGSITTTNLNLSGSGTSNILSAAGDIALTSSTGDVTVTCKDTLGLYAGVGGTAGIIKISPSGPATPSYTSVYMTLSEANDKIIIGGPTLSIIADAVELSAEITYPIARHRSLAIPYIGFSRDNTQNTVLNVSNDSLGIKIEGDGTPGGIAYLDIALPDSIPDGSEITAIWGGFRWSASSGLSADLSITLYECAIGSSSTYTLISSDITQISPDGNYHFKTFDISHTVAKNKATTISVYLSLPTTHIMYFYGLRVMYDTSKVDINTAV